MDVDCDDFYQTCRLCLSKLNGSSVSLYDDNTKSSHENNNYPYKIHFCFSISVNQKENLPNVLCQACCRDLDRFFKFKEKVLKNNTFLESYRRQNSEYARKKHKRGGSSRSHDTSSSSEKSDSRNNTENITKHVKTRIKVEGKDNEKQLDLSVNRKVKEENDIAYNHQNGTVVRTGEYIVENDSNGAIHFVSPGKIKEETFMEDYDSEETRSANTDTCREEDEYKLIIDEDPLSSQTDNNVSVGSQDSYSENCILLKTLMSSNPMGQVQYVLQPRITDDGEKSSGRRKQKCPTKSTDIDDKTDIIREETVEDVTDISEREEVVESSHTQFIENVLARHNSPGVTPISLAPDMMNVACEVLLRAAIEIQCSSSDGQNMSPSFDHNSDTSNQQSPSMYEIDIIPNNRSVKRYRRPSKDKNQNLQTEKECSNCHAKQTTIWRRDRFGKIVCNACGLYYKLHKYDRPGRMRRDEIHKRNRKRNVNGGNGNGKLKKHKRNDSQMVLSYGSPGQGYSPSTPTEHYQVSPQYETVEIFPSPNTPTNYIKQEIINVCRGTTPDSTGSNSSHSSLNNLMDQEKIMTAFQLSTHFLPISSSYETDENPINEAPLNLAASGH